MISDDELLNLPDDPELAFVHYEETLRKRVQTEIDTSGGYNIEGLQIEYISHVLGVVKALDLKILENWEMPSVAQASGLIENQYKQLLADVAHYVVQIRVKNARRLKRYSVALDPAVKQQIRHHLDRIKEIVDRLEVPLSKKEALIARIGALETEVSRDRTRIDAAMALVLEAANTGGEAGKRLEPVRKLIDSITGLFGSAKEEEEKISRLNGPEDRKQIQGPRRQLPAPEESAGSEDLEDEIPF